MAPKFCKDLVFNVVGGTVIKIFQPLAICNEKIYPSVFKILNTDFLLRYTTLSTDFEWLPDSFRFFYIYPFNNEMTEKLFHLFFGLW